jgi:hypothetical protein
MSPTSSALHGLAGAAIICGSSRRHTGQVAWVLSRNSLPHQPAMQSPWNLSIKTEDPALLDGGFMCKQRTQGRGSIIIGSIIIPEPWYTTSKVRSTIIGGGADWGNWPVMWFGSSNRTNAQHPNYNLTSGIQKKRSGLTMLYISYSIDKMHSKHYLISGKGPIDEWSLA